MGRGTDTPFEVIGAPYIDDVLLAQQLNALKKSGVTFVPIRFTPDYSVHKDESCGGVNIIITDQESLKPVALGIDIARVLYAMYPKKFPLSKVDRLLCHPPTIEAIRQGKTIQQIEMIWQSGLVKFKKRRAEFLLYD